MSIYVGLCMCLDRVLHIYREKKIKTKSLCRSLQAKAGLMALISRELALVSPHLATIRQTSVLVFVLLYLYLNLKHFEKRNNIYK